MAGLINITLVGDRALIARLQAMPTAVVASVTRAVNASLLKVQGHIVADKLSGQVLKVVTGNLRRSITVQEAEEVGTAVRGYVYSAGDVKYAAIHEFGFNGVEQVSEHMRTVVFGRKVPPFVVPSFSRHMNMPERSFMRSGLADLREEIGADISAAAKRGAREAVKA